MSTLVIPLLYKTPLKIEIPDICARTVRTCRSLLSQPIMERPAVILLQAGELHTLPWAHVVAVPSPSSPVPYVLIPPPLSPNLFQCLEPNSRSLKRSHISVLNICLGGSQTVCFGVVRVQSSAASSTHVSLPFTAYSTPSTSPANRFVSVGPRDPSFVNIPQQTQVGRFRLLCLPAASSPPPPVSSNVSPRSSCTAAVTSPTWSQ